jgi:hypothetical protein
VVAHRPDVAKFQYARGLGYVRSLRFGAARGSFERALAIYPAYDRAQDMLGKLDGLEQDAARLLSPGAGSTVERARLLAWLGRAPEATQVWLALLSRPDISPTVAHDGAEFIIRFGPPSAARSAFALYAGAAGVRLDPELGRAFEARLAMVERLARLTSHAG